MKLNKKELLKSPQRKWNDISRGYNQILIIPAGTKHDSGYMHIAIIGVYEEKNETKYEICGFPDDISTLFEPVKLSDGFNFAQVRMDCYYPSGILQYHGRGKFYVSESLSSMDIKFKQD